MSRNFSEHLKQFHEDGVSIIHRSITIEEDGGEINSQTSNRFLKNLKTLEAINNSPITVYINSVGGSVIDGFNIYDLISCSSCVIKCVVGGQASSAASLILQAGDERHIYPNSVVMVHYGEESLSGHPKVVNNWHECNKELERRFEKVFLKRIKQKKPKYTIKQLKELLEHDSILFPKQALELGLVDHIIEEKEIVK